MRRLPPPGTDAGAATNTRARAEVHALLADISMENDGFEAAQADLETSASFLAKDALVRVRGVSLGCGSGPRGCRGAAAWALGQQPVLQGRGAAAPAARPAGTLQTPASQRASLP
jgi:hypothetical protein